MNPILLSAIFGFLKGFTSSDPSPGFNADTDFWGPLKEEVIYRGAPLWAFPKLPWGSTAAIFAAEHLADDYRSGQKMTSLDVVARLGDVFLGGMLYETAMRRSGIVAAIAAHAAHNNAVSLGQQLRNGKKP